MRKFVILGLTLIVLGGFALADKTITIRGSDTMLILGQRWAEVYMKKNPDSRIQISGGGSVVGIASLINGTTDITQASRHMYKEEEDSLISKRGKRAVEFRVALDAITLYVSDKNPVESLTFDQLQEIFQGRITNWKEVGGRDARIVLYGREITSGTREFIRMMVLNMGDYDRLFQSLPGTAAIVNAVAKDENGIGYGGVAYAKGVKRMKVALDEGSGYYLPEREYVMTGQYPLARYLYWYTAGPPKGEIKKLLDWVLSPEGQGVVEEVGYFPLVTRE